MFMTVSMPKNTFHLNSTWVYDKTLNTKWKHFTIIKVVSDNPQLTLQSKVKSGTSDQEQDMTPTPHHFQHSF